MSFYMNESIEEQVFEQLTEELGREPNDEELDAAIAKLGDWEPDWDLYGDEQKLDHNGDY